MNINPKIPETVSKVSIDLNSKTQNSKNEVSQVENIVLEAPKMDLKSVMPKDKIVIHKCPKKDFDVEKAIEEFNDINDTETISKICESWRGDLDQLREKFSAENLKVMADPYSEHIDSVGRINTKYDKFVQKISDIIDASNHDIPEDVNMVFETYIDPMIQYSQETFSVVDNMPEVANAYRSVSDMNITLEERLSKTDSIEGIQSLLPDIDKLMKTDPIRYQTAMTLMERRVNEILSDGNIQAEPSIIDKTDEKAGVQPRSVSDYSKMDVKSLQKEIQALTEQDLVSDKFTLINDTLTHMAKTKNKDYDKLSEVFNAKIVELSENI